MGNNLLDSLVEAAYEYVYTEKGKEVLKDFKHYVKRYNRYKVSLVKPYIAPEKPFLPGLQDAA